MRRNPQTRKPTTGLGTGVQRLPCLFLLPDCPELAVICGPLRWSLSQCVAAKQHHSIQSGFQSAREVLKQSNLGFSISRQTRKRMEIIELVRTRRENANQHIGFSPAQCNRCADNPARWLSGQPAEAKTCGGGVRVDEDSGVAAQNAVSRARKNRLDVHVSGCHLQLGEDAESSGCKRIGRSVSGRPKLAFRHRVKAAQKPLSQRSTAPNPAPRL